MQVMYIEERALISPQEPFCDTVLDSPVMPANGLVQCKDPDFRQFIPASALRRMPLLLKRAVSSAVYVLNGRAPQAVITGTGTGTMQSSEDFLLKIGELGEYALPPTAFINSTHNTIGSAVAIALGCKGYNMTFAHSGLSFESALLDAMLRFRLGYNTEILLGAHEEIPEHYYNLMASGGVFDASHPVSSHSATFLLSSSRTERSRAAITGFWFGNVPDVSGLVLCADEAAASRRFPSARCMSYRDVFGYSYSFGAVSFFCACLLVERSGLERVSVYNEFNGQETLAVVEALS